MTKEYNCFLKFKCPPKEFEFEEGGSGQVWSWTKGGARAWSREPREGLLLQSR